MKNQIDRNVARKDSFKSNQITKTSNGKPPIFSWIEFSLSGLCNRL